MSVEAKLSQMSIAHPTFDQVFDNIPQTRLRELVEADSGPIETKTVKRTKLKQMIYKSINGVAARTLADNLKKEQLAQAIEPLNIDHGENNPSNKRVLYKRFLEKVSEMGIAAYIAEYVELDLAKQFAEAVNVKATGKTAEAIGKQIADQLEYEAVEAYWQSFYVETLHDVALDMKLETAEPESSSKQVLIEAILSNEQVKKLEKKRPKTEQIKLNPSSKKPSKIADGISFDDLHYWWGVQDLKEWAKERKIMTSGNKPELINRILAYLAGDKENTLTKEPAERARKPRKKSEETKKRIAKAKRNKAKKEQEAAGGEKKKPAAKPKATTTKKETVKPVEPEPVAEEEEAIDEIDLDNLDQYSISQLKKYCAEEEIEVTGTSKKAYMAAIEKYNEPSDEEGEDGEEGN